MSGQMGRRRVRYGRVHSDEGAAVVEYVGMIVAVCALLVSMIALVTPIGNSINQVLCKAVGSLTGDSSCGGSGGTAGGDGTKAPPKTPCVQGSTKNSAKSVTSISVVDVKGSGTAKMDRLSDGTYVVTVSDKTGVDAVARTGGVSASLKDKGIDIGASASAGGSTGTEAKYTFDNEADAQQFMDWATGRTKASMVPGVGGLAYDVGNYLFGSYSPPKPSSSVVVVEAGVAAQGSASADFGVVGAKAKAAGEGVVGATIDTVTGETTVYEKVDISAGVSGKAGLSLKTFLPDGLGGGDAKLKDAGLSKELIDAGAKLEATERSTYDANGNLIKKSLVVSWNAGANSALGDLGRTGEIYTADIPVNDQNRAQVESSGWPWVSDPFGTAVQFGGDSTKRTVEVVSDQDFEAKVKAEVTGIGGLGLSVTSGSEETTTKDAAYLNENGTWINWDGCL